MYKKGNLLGGRLITAWGHPFWIRDTAPWQPRAASAKDGRPSSTYLLVTSRGDVLIRAEHSGRSHLNIRAANILIRA